MYTKTNEEYPKGYILKLQIGDNPNDLYPLQKWLKYKESIINIPIANGAIGQKICYWIRVK